MDETRAHKLAKVLQKSWCELSPFTEDVIFEFVKSLPEETEDENVSDMPEFQAIYEGYMDWLGDQ